MALEITYKILIGDANTPDDFTSRCTGFSVKQSAPMSNMSANTAVITLTNYDGALTPNAGGTYSSTDWFAQGVFIRASIQGTNLLSAEIFNGSIVDFDITDDGVSSTVNLRCQDGIRWLGTVADDVNITLVSLVDDGFTNCLVQSLSQLGDNPPQLGSSSSTYGAEYAAIDNANKLDTSNATSGTLSDLLRTELLPSYPSAFWATDVQYNSGLDRTIWNYMVLGAGLTRSTSTGTWYLDRQDFDFTENATAAGEIPFAQLEVGFNNNDLVNNVIQTTSATSNTSTASNSTSINSYGVRTATNSLTTNKTDAFAQDAANNYVNRQSSIRYTPMMLSTTTSRLALADDDTDYDVQALFDVRSVLWNHGTVTYTPTGASSSTTDGVVIVGRSIRATPAETTIVLELLPAADYQSFTLDSDVLGVLDQNRLG